AEVYIGIIALPKRVDVFQSLNGVAAVKVAVINISLFQPGTIRLYKYIGTVAFGLQVKHTVAFQPQAAQVNPAELFSCRQGRNCLIVILVIVSPVNSRAVN